MKTDSQLSLNYETAIEASYQATSQEWKDKAMELLKKYAVKGHRFITEDFRIAFKDELPEPKEPRCYGGLMRLAKKAGIIAATGIYQPTKSETSHSRPMMVWVGQM